MGTNYYRKPILTKERREKMIKLIDEGKYRSYDEDPESSVMNMVDDLDRGVHICKMSWGWKVNFDHNWGKYYKLNRKSIDKFLKEPGYTIEDEYGEVFTPEEFWQEVDGHNNNPKNNWVSKTYDEYERKNGNYYSYLCTEDIAKCAKVFGIHADSNDFESDGLRFAVFTDFS